MILNTDNDESRRVVEQCYRTVSTLVNPIIDWKDADVWDFLRAHGCEGNPLYKEGFVRIGCISCPFADHNGMIRDLNRWPAYKKMYLSAFDRMLKERKKRGVVTTWETPQEVMDWWIRDENVPGQMKLELEEDADERPYKQGGGL